MAKDLLIIIQARVTSTRLPGKILLPLCGKTALEIMLDRLDFFRKHIIIATTNDGSEKPIVQLCESGGIKYYQGDTDDVLSRYYETAKKYGAKKSDKIVRLTSDCPLIDQDILKKIIGFYEAGEYDYVSNTYERTYPRGLDCEVFSFKALEESFNKAKTTFEKEHVTTYIHTTHKDEFTIGSFKDEKDNSKYRLTLDEKDDYEAIEELYKLFQCRVSFSYNELINKLESNKYIYDINHHIEQKKQ